MSRLWLEADDIIGGQGILTRRCEFDVKEGVRNLTYRFLGQKEENSSVLVSQALCTGKAKLPQKEGSLGIRANAYPEGRREGKRITSRMTRKQLKYNN